MIKIIGIPFDANSSFLKGPSYAPQRIRLMDKEGSANSFSESGLEVKRTIITKIVVILCSKIPILKKHLRL